MPSYVPSMITLGADKTFTAAEIAAYGNQPQDFDITQGSAIAITLVAPSKAQNGLQLTFTTSSPYLHVITATSLFASGGTSSPYTTATASNTQSGATIVLKAYNALWTVVSLQNWALT